MLVVLLLFLYFCFFLLFPDKKSLFYSFFCLTFYSPLKLTSHGILHYFYGQRIYQKAFPNWLCQYLPFLNNFFNSIYPVEKCGATQHCQNRDSLTLSWVTDSRDNIDVLATFSCLNVESLQCNVETFGVQNCVIRKTITFSALSIKWKMRFILRYHERSVSELVFWW